MARRGYNPDELNRNPTDFIPSVGDSLDSEDADNTEPSDPTPPPTTGNPVVDRALNESLPTYEAFTEYSDEEKEHQELRLSQVIRAAERKKEEIRKLELEYNDLLLKAGMIKHSLQYKEGFVA